MEDDMTRAPFPRRVTAPHWFSSGLCDVCLLLLLLLQAHWPTYSGARLQEGLNRTPEL